MPKTPVWERIESLPGSNNLAEFCRKIGLDYEKFKKSHKRNNGPPDSTTLDKIARHFRLDLAWLITGKTCSTPLNRRIGKKLKLLRKKNGWSLEEMGKNIYIFPEILQNYENGNWPITPDLLHDLAPN
jgi:ribosome-binding protein aMBF1 (putative translation factor)